MTDKFYRLRKDNPTWIAGAVLKLSGDDYHAISDIWNQAGIDGDYYETAHVVEKAPDWFERVYPVNIMTKTVYKLKEEARALFEKDYQ